MNKWDMEALPGILKNKVQKCIWKQITVGESGAYTFLLTAEEVPNRYLKIIPRKLMQSVESEVVLLRWLNGKLPVPEVLLHISDSEYEYLLMSEIKGICSYEHSLGSDIPEVVRLLAKGLRMIHRIDIRDCPIEQRLDMKIKKAEYRMMNGLVDENNFDDVHQGKKAADLYKELMDTRPCNEDLVLTHGDYCLPNILIDNWDISGFIDWGRGGVSDRYQDLALASRSLVYNFGARWVPLLFEEYGIEEIDYSKIRYYKLLDEFF